MGESAQKKRLMIVVKPLMFLTCDYLKPTKLGLFSKSRLFLSRKNKPNFRAVGCCAVVGDISQQLHTLSIILSDAESTTVPLGLPPEPKIWERYLISIAFVLGIVVTVGVVFVTFAEWRDRRLKESSTQVEKKDKNQQPTQMNRFARRLKKKEDKLRARRKL